MSLKKKLITTTFIATLSCYSLASFAVSNVQVNGNNVVDSSVILSYLNFVPGQPATTDQINQSIKALYDTGLFRDISIRKSGGGVVVDVVENPVVSRVYFEGNKKVKDKELLGLISVQPSTVLSPSKIQQDTQKIISAYEARGYNSVTVNPKQIDRNGSRVDVVYEINENFGFKKEGIDRINFVGNTTYSDNTLKGEIITRQSRWYGFLIGNDTYDPDRVDFDKKMITRFYQKNGFADIQVVSAVAERSSSNGGYHMTYTISEGDRYNFGNVGYRIGVPGLNSSDLNGTLKVRPGSRFNIDRVDETVQNMSERLAKIGYPFVRVQPQYTKDRVNNVVDVAFVLTQGPANYVERVDIVGNNRTRDHVIRRQVSLAEGDALNSHKLRMSKKRVENLGYFNKVNIAPTPGSTPDSSVLRVSVDEKSTSSLNFGIGYGSLDGLSGNASYANRNLFGMGYHTNLDVGISQYRQKAKFSFTDPYFLNKPISAGFDIYGDLTDYQDEYSADELNYGVTLRMGYRWNDYFTQSWAYNYEHSEFKNVSDNISPYIANYEEEKRNKSSLSHTLAFDTRDSRIIPTKGIYTYWTIEYAGLGGDVEFLRNSGRFSIWQPLYKDYVISAHARAGHVEAKGDNNYVSFFDRYHLGEPYVRGFDRSGIDPRDANTGDSLGGNWYVALSTQLDFPLPVLKDFNLRGRVFADAGKVGENDFVPNADILYTDEWRYSAGFGLSMDVPMIGTLSVDYTPYTKGEEWDEEQEFFIYMGYNF